MNSISEQEQMHVFTSFPEDAQDDENSQVSVLIFKSKFIRKRAA